jgi:hypothetical protein
LEIATKREIVRREIYKSGKDEIRTKEMDEKQTGNRWMVGRMEKNLVRKLEIQD